MANIDHLNLDLDNDGVEEEYKLQDTVTDVYLETMEDYDALPDTKYTDGKHYHIKKASGLHIINNSITSDTTTWSSSEIDKKFGVVNQGLMNITKLAVTVPANEEIYLGDNTYIKRILKTIDSQMDVDTVIDTLPSGVSEVTMLQLFANFSNQMRVFGGLFVSCMYNQNNRQVTFRQKYSNSFSSGITVSCVVAYKK